MNILICRLRPWMAIKVAENLIAQGHTVHAIDHAEKEVYKAAKIFASCYTFFSTSPPEQTKQRLQEILIQHKIDLVIIAQKLHRYSNAAEAACKAVGVKFVFTECFFDDKLIFDDLGLQYTPETQCVGESSLPVAWPKSDRELQPEDLSLAKLKKRYGLVRGMKVVVIYGQLIWDMSLTKAPVPITYAEYIDQLCEKNPDTLFLFKPHPRSRAKRGSSNRICEGRSNLIFANESLRSLFQLPAHTAYSSTVIFEGVARYGLRFASVGYHLMRGHTHQIQPDGFRNIYERIISHQPNKRAIARAASWLTNCYAMDMGDPKLSERLINGLQKEKGAASSAAPFGNEEGEFDSELNQNPLSSPSPPTPASV